jgi:hypothetical protein
MYPGLSDADCQVATFRYRQLVDEGQRQQISTGAGLASGVTRLVSGSVRRQVGAFMVSAGQRIQGVQMVTSEGLVKIPTGEMVATA